MARPVRIIIHNTAVKSDNHQLIGVNNYHTNKGYPLSSLGWCVGYTYFLEKDGELTQTRTDTEQQAHTKGYNFDSIGICLAINGDAERPTEVQLLVLKNLLLKKMEEWDISSDNIFFHRDFSPKSCPGYLLSKQEIKDLVKIEISVPAPVIEPKPVEPTPAQISYFQNILNHLKKLLTELLNKTKVGKINDTPCWLSDQRG